MEQLPLNQFCRYLEYAEKTRMKMLIREIVTTPDRQRTVKPWSPLSYHDSTLSWHDTTISYPRMDGYKRKILMKDMRFRMDLFQGKANIRESNSNLYLQIKIEISDTL